MKVEFKACFRRNMGRFTFDEFADILIKNMKKGGYIGEHEICGFVGTSEHYICVNKEQGCIIVPIIIEGYVIPFEIVIDKEG